MALRDFVIGHAAAVVLASSALLLAGCGGKKAPAPPTPAAALPPAAPRPGGGGIPRLDLRVKSQNNLLEIGRAYQMALATRAPRNVDELKEHLEQAERILKSPVDEQTYEIVWGVEPSQVETGSSTTLLAWEKVGDPKGARNVLMADCRRVLHVSAAEFEKLSKAKGK